jgi:hypothetical protein
VKIGRSFLREFVELVEHGRIGECVDNSTSTLNGRCGITTTLLWTYLACRCLSASSYRWRAAPN